MYEAHRMTPTEAGQSNTWNEFELGHYRSLSKISGSDLARFGNRQDLPHHVGAIPFIWRVLYSIWRG
jgi:hypothetical protein